MSANSHDETHAVRSAVGALEVLTFSLGSEEYAVDLLKVQEIRSYEAPTRIVNSPPSVLGVLNLRGNIVPVVDLRAKLGLELAQFAASTVTIILNVGAGVVGAVVDSVADVVDLAADQIKPAPAFGAGVETNYMMGLGTVGNEENKRMLIILDLGILLAGMLAHPTTFD